MLQNLDYLRETRADTVVILSGDHIYKMDYRPMMRAHEERRADLTVAVMDVPAGRDLALRHRADRRGRPRDAFPGKAQGCAQHAGQHGRLRLQRAGADGADAGAAKEYPDLDFGKHVIPSMVESHRIYAYPFDGYWVDVGTVDAYWGTSMELISGRSKLNLYDPSWVIHTKSEERAPAKLGPQAGAYQSMICNGCIVRGQVVRSVLSPGVYVSPGAVVRDSILMNDTWIGPGAVVDRCIVDKNVVVGSGTQLGWGDDYDTPNAQAPGQVLHRSDHRRQGRTHPGRQAYRAQRRDPDRCGRGRL